MNTNTRRLTSRIAAGLLVPAMLSVSTAQAAEAVPWDELPKKLELNRIHGKRPNRQYHVVTTDGKTYADYGLVFSPTDVKLMYAGSSIPREQVKEIRISRHGRFWDAFFVPADALLTRIGGEDAFVLLLIPPISLVMVPLSVGLTAAAAPIVLPTEGIKRLLPDNVIQVAP